MLSFFICLISWVFNCYLVQKKATRLVCRYNCFFKRGTAIWIISCYRSVTNLSIINNLLEIEADFINSENWFGVTCSLDRICREQNWTFPAVVPPNFFLVGELRRFHTLCMTSALYIFYESIKFLYAVAASVKIIESM